MNIHPHTHLLRHRFWCSQRGILNLRSSFVFLLGTLGYSVFLGCFWFFWLGGVTTSPLHYSPYLSPDHVIHTKIAPHLSHFTLKEESLHTPKKPKRCKKCVKRLTGLNSSIWHAQNIRSYSMFPAAINAFVFKIDLSNRTPARFRVLNAEMADVLSVSLKKWGDRIWEGRKQREALCEEGAFCACWFLIFANFAQCNSPWTKAMWLLHTTDAGNGFSCGFGCKLFSRCFATCGLTALEGGDGGDTGA